MKIRKKFMVIGILTVVLLAGIFGGVALADTEEESNPVNGMFDRVAAILNGNGVDINSEQLQSAFEQARSEIRDETLDNRQERLQTMLEEGKITQEQYDNMLSRLENLPERPLQDFSGKSAGRSFFGGPRPDGPGCPPEAE